MKKVYYLEVDNSFVRDKILTYIAERIDDVEFHILDLYNAKLKTTASLEQISKIAITSPYQVTKIRKAWFF